MSNVALPYLLWVPLTILYNGAMCWVSVRYNQTDFLKTYVCMVGLGFLPTWSIAAYFSRNMVFDALLYDGLLVASSPLLLALLGQATHFTAQNWLGVILAITGLILTRW